MALEEDEPLRGSCSCGRNQFLLVLPHDTDAARNSSLLFFDSSRESRRIHASPLPTFLRVPLSYIQSTTYALYPNESHNEIRRAFSPLSAPNSIKHFCGFCGTPLTSWTDAPIEESDFIRVSLGSFETSSVYRLVDLGILPSLVANGVDDVEVDVGDGRPGGVGGGGKSGGEAQAGTGGREVVRAGGGDNSLDDSTRTASSPRDVSRRPIFDEIVEDSDIGKIWRKWGRHVSGNGRTQIEWEIVEYGKDFRGGEGGGNGSTKRKIDEVAIDNDTSMKDDN